MMGQTRHYCVAGLTFGVSLEEPWRFMEYSAPVLQRIATAASGEIIDIVPTRAGDAIPARTYIKSKDEIAETVTAECLDFSQYEPFVTENDKDYFNIIIKSHSLPKPNADDLIYKNEEILPFSYIYKSSDGIILTFESEKDVVAASVHISADSKTADFFPADHLKRTSVMFYFNMAIMLVFANNVSHIGGLLMHASAIEHNGKTNLFLGESGTGKSTHAKLWLENITGCELVNDDNPVLKSEDSGVYVYGTPWSGKTPCYRNKKVPVRAIVRLHQALHNTLVPLTGLNSYASLLSSISAIRWDRSVMDDVTKICSDIAMTTHFWNMDCLPDAEAAEICCKTTEEDD